MDFEFRICGKIEGTPVTPTPVLTQFFKKFQLRRFCFVGQNSTSEKSKWRNILANKQEVVLTMSVSEVETRF